MSNAIGAARFEDGTIYWCEYYGTVDVMNSQLHKTYESLELSWRVLNNQAWCDTNNHKPEPVELTCNYGTGWTWPATACRNCMWITSNFTPHDPDSENPSYYPDHGTPDWFTELLRKQFNG